MNAVSLNGFQWPVFQQSVIQTTKELPDEFPFNLDTNSGKPLGLGIIHVLAADINGSHFLLGWLQSTIGDGMRSSSATSYLANEFIQRENLHVLLHAQVSRLVNVDNSTGKPTFRGVQFSQGIGRRILFSQHPLIV